MPERSVFGIGGSSEKEGLKPVTVKGVGGQ
jgi:hypothetical protein